jgi:uncharacterized membrane protein
VKIHLKTIKKLGNILKMDNNNGYAVSVLIALILVSILVASYYVLLRPPQKGYMTIYLLDSQKKALNYPELLVVNQNNTFNVWVEVENHMGKSQYSEILLKVTNDTIPLFPFKADANATYVRTLENGETWETLSTIAINEPGNYSVIFELWIYDEKVGELQFSGNVCVLNIAVVGQV